MTFTRWFSFWWNGIEEEDFIPQAEELVHEILQQYPSVLYQFQSEIIKDTPDDEKPPSGREMSERARNWMVTLAMRGYYYGYPECCIREFIEDFSDEDELGRRHREDILEHVPCRRCHRQLIPRKKAA